MTAPLAGMAGSARQPPIVPCKVLIFTWCPMKLSHYRTCSKN